MIKWIFKMVLSIAFDVFDFFLGRIPGVGTIIDIVGGFLGIALWGGRGALQFLEIIDLTDQIDGFVPTLTIAGLTKLGEVWD
ncbi:MAG TPA: hypothetical protein VJH22_03540 [Candidatus Nanoarchaeia archaeon]|nr:hypothetical protein [Candidatus Nanoarchaeia archaeon]